MLTRIFKRKDSYNEKLRKSQATAMQIMLENCAYFRRNGYTTAQIDAEMKDGLALYDSIERGERPPFEYYELSR